MLELRVRVRLSLTLTNSKSLISISQKFDILVNKCYVDYILWSEVQTSFVTFSGLLYCTLQGRDFYKKSLPNFVIALSFFV